MLLFGVFLLFASIRVGLLVIAICIAWLIFQKSTFSIVLTAAGGEVKAYTSHELPEDERHDHDTEQDKRNVENTGA